MCILISALALYIYEQALYEKILERDLDTLDGLVATETPSEGQNISMGHWQTKGKSSWRKQRVSRPA